MCPGVQNRDTDLDLNRHLNQDQKQGLDAKQGDSPTKNSSIENNVDAGIDNPSTYEETHVHSVYDAIADHFSATRYSPWPLVARFLEAQPAGSIGLDVGCGNGKYLSGPTGNPDSNSRSPAQFFVLGSDRSTALAKLAYEKHARQRTGADVLVADSLALPFRDECADFIICIAVVHHLSTRERRQAAVAELLRCVRPTQKKEDEDPQSAVEHQPRNKSFNEIAAEKSATVNTPLHLQEKTKESAGPPLSSLSSGRVLLYVWALEQASSRRGWAAGGEQDLLVPWVKTMKDKTQTAKDHKKSKSQKPEPRAGPEESEGPEKAKDLEQPENLRQPQVKQPHVPPTFHRYYHLYRDGELEEDVAAAGGRVVASGYEKDNWWVVADAL